MSSDPENQPQPENPQPQASPETPPGPVSQTNRASRQNPNLLKTVALKGLRATIGSLKGVMDKLEAEPPPRPAKPTVSAKNKPTLTRSPAPILETVSNAPTPAPTSKAESVPLRSQQNFWGKLGSIWLGFVRLIRSLLPAPLNQQLSETLLSAAIAAILIIAIGTTLNILTAQPPEVATVPPPQLTQPEAVQPQPIPPEATPPQPTQPETVPSEAVEPTATQPEPTRAQAKKLPDLVAPAEPKPLEITPPPPPKLTPEQYLIATIQKQVTDITNQFDGGLVQSIQANFPSSLLTVKISDEWYSLSETQQDQLANQMLQQAKRLDFSKLEITNSQGKKIARSPVIGQETIILERRQNADANS